MKKAKLKLSIYKKNKFILFPHLIKEKLQWKDKFKTPRCEREPYFIVEWLWFGIYGVWGDDQYWEQWLWVNYYYNGDIDKAKKEWNWRDIKTNQSTWVDF